MVKTRHLELIRTLSSFLALSTTGCQEPYESVESDDLDPVKIDALLTECREIMSQWYLDDVAALNARHLNW